MRSDFSLRTSSASPEAGENIKTTTCIRLNCPRPIVQNPVKPCIYSVVVPEAVSVALCLCVCVCFIPFILDVRLVDVPAGVTQEEGHTGFFRLPSAVLAFIFLAKRNQPFLSLVDRKVEFCWNFVY